MKELSIHEIRSIQLSILRYIDHLCEEKGINYYLCGGTLLGAIRHNGYIPWDDDIDIMLFREDYDELVNEIGKNGVFRCLSYTNTSDYYYPFAKIVDSRTKLIEKNTDYQVSEMGVFVDMFPIDGLPNDEKTRKLHYKKIMKLRRLYYLSLNKSFPKSSFPLFKFIKYIIWLYAKKHGWKYWLRKIDITSRQYITDNCDYVGNVVAGYGERETYHRKLYNKKKKIPFENYCFTIPGGYDEYLKCLYGDYMRLPPVEKRITRHDFVVYLKEAKDI